MSIKKGLLVSFGLVILCLLAGMVFLLQPSGQVSDFQKWQYQASQKTASTSMLRVKFFGVSTLLFDDGKTQILIDGFFSRPSLSQVLFQKIQSQPEMIQRMIQQQHLQRDRDARCEPREFLHGRLCSGRCTWSSVACQT